MASKARFSWFEGADLPDYPVRQVYGYVLDQRGQVLLLRDEGKFNLPGGRPERGESWAEVLRRDVLEEVQVTLASCDLLGYQLVEGDEVGWDGSPYLQLRYVAQLSDTSRCTVTQSCDLA